LVGTRAVPKMRARFFVLSTVALDLIALGLFFVRIISGVTAARIANAVAWPSKMARSDRG
ncbi:MAG: hypothetical protein ABIR29_06605, partial [Chthoniobacterales bacterium]